MQTGDEQREGSETLDRPLSLLLFHSLHPPVNMLVPLSSALAAVDNAVANMGLCTGFVFALPPDCPPDASHCLVDNIRQAARRVTSKWNLLRGQPTWLDEVSSECGPAQLELATSP